MSKPLAHRARTMQALLPLREACKSRWLSRYRLFWRSAAWEPFLIPSKGGFTAARAAAASYSGTSALMDQPGVYELAIVKGKDSRRYKVYVGQTCSMRRRFHQEYRGPSGSHLKEYFAEALKNDCEIWRRCRYTKTAEEARRREALFLRQYDYAWNSRQAGCQPRHVDIRITQNCFSKSVHLVSKPGSALVHDMHAAAR